MILMASAAYLASSVSSFDNSPHLNARVTSAALIMDGNDNENDQIKFEMILRMTNMENMKNMENIENMEKMKHEKNQPDELKHSLYDSKHSIYDSKHCFCQPDYSKHSFSDIFGDG